MFLGIGSERFQLAEDGVVLLLKVSADSSVNSNPDLVSHLILLFLVRLEGLVITLPKGLLYPEESPDPWMDINRIYPKASL